VHSLYSCVQERASEDSWSVVKGLVMINMFSIEIDTNITTRDEVKKKVLEIATRAGLKQKIVFLNQVVTKNLLTS
jgi:hypothetical protein